MSNFGQLLSAGDDWEITSREEISTQAGGDEIFIKRWMIVSMLIVTYKTAPEAKYLCMPTPSLVSKKTNLPYNFILSIEQLHILQCQVDQIRPSIRREKDSKDFVQLE